MYPLTECTLLALAAGPGIAQPVNPSIVPKAGRPLPAFRQPLAPKSLFAVLQIKTTNLEHYDVSFYRLSSPTSRQPGGSYPECDISLPTLPDEDVVQHTSGAERSVAPSYRDICVFHSRSPGWTKKRVKRNAVEGNIVPRLYDSVPLKF